MILFEGIILNQNAQEKNITVLIWLTYALIILNTADALVTYYVISSGISQEYSPVVAKAISFFGLEVAMLLKVIILAAVVVLLLKYPFKLEFNAWWHYPTTFILATSGVLFMTFVVTGNILVLFGVIE
jgi:hypothetical protein